MKYFSFIYPIYRI